MPLDLSKDVVVGAAAGLLAGLALAGLAGSCCAGKKDAGKTAAGGKPAAVAPAATSSAPVVPEEEILREQFARNIAFLGEDGYKALSEVNIVVVGLGGVGSHAGTWRAAHAPRTTRGLTERRRAFPQHTCSSGPAASGCG